jgi:3-dehydroquinate synthase
MRSVELVLDAAVEAGLDRNCRFVGVGGGVVCDLTAFASSVYLRGVDLLLVPTTLLCMVDAALGGKTGIDFSGYKNMVGTFYPAREIHVWPGALKTLAERDYRSGIAEVVKTAMLGDAELLDLIENEREHILERDEEMLETLVRRCLKVKGSIVEEDFTESGKRAFLNLGHTFGHALESLGGFSQWTHGEAVAWGLDCALDLGVEIGLTDQKYRERIRGLLESYGFVLNAEPDTGAVLAAMQKDKKRKAGSLRFVLQSGPEDTKLMEVEDSALEKVLKAH